MLGLRALRGMYEAPFTVDKGRAALAGISESKQTSKQTNKQTNKQYQQTNCGQGKGSTCRSNPLSQSVGVICLNLHAMQYIPSF